MAHVLLEARGIVKRFPGTIALNGVDFKVYPGEIHALVGENGAGKSTLMKILAGVYQPDEGALLLDGVETMMSDPLIAQLAGVGIVHQELSIFPTLSVAENIFANRQPVKSGLVDFAAMYAEAEKLMAEFGLNVRPTTLAGQLSVSEQQVVEIIKAVSLQPKVLILDEPTSALSEAEIYRLFDILNKLKAKNIGIVYISHKLKEILTLSDRITVLRDGQLVGEISVADASEPKLIQMMVGREANTVYPAKNTAPDKRVIMEAKNIMVPGKVIDFGFKVAEGEVLGVFGLMGAGRTEMARRIFGLGPGSADIEIEGRPISVKSPSDAMKNGIAYLTEDRKGDGVFLDMTVASNVASANLDHVSKSGLIDEAASENITESLVKKLRIKVASVTQLTGNLSGGNQQKVLLAKYIHAAPKVLIVDEPTRGIDVAAKSEIHGLLRELANEGMAIIVISSELPEVMGLSDRIIVMCNGRLTGEVEGSEMNETTIMALATKFISETGGRQVG